MKKLIVVVDGKNVGFQAEKPVAYFDSDGILIISCQEKNEKLGAFAKWDYWCYTQE